MSVVMTLEAIAEKGRRIYSETLSKEYEGQFDGQFLAIDVANGQAYLGEYPEDALELAKEHNPYGDFYLVKIGAEATFHVGYLDENAKTNMDGVLQPAT